jgi:cytochrome c oxidase subunit 4
MSAHHHHEDIQSLYEGDQSKLYSGVLAHHTDVKSDASKKQVKRIWQITGWLSLITIVEVAIGLGAHYAGVHSALILTVFLLLTLVKAALIVRVFMHLGDEKKNFVFAVLMPLSLFIWFIIAFIADGKHWLHMNNTQADTINTEVKK